MKAGPTSEFNVHMYIIHFLNILYHYMCATRAHQWGKRSGATYRGQFCQWRASINPRFASAINYRSRWGSKHPLNTCTSCKACSSRKSSNPVARSLQPPLTCLVFSENLKNCFLEKSYVSSHKLPKQQSTNFWSQGILGINKCSTPSYISYGQMFKYYLLIIFMAINKIWLNALANG
jgi:hypothetical protein